MFQLIDPATRGLAAATFMGMIVFASPLRAATTDEPQLSGAPLPAAHGYLAQATPAPAAPSQQGPAKPTPANPVEAHITRLHDRLKITDAQASQWNTVAQVMRDNAKAMQAVHQKRAQNLKTMTAVEDLRSYQEIVDTHSQELQKLIPAFQALYDTMSDDQKKNADKVFSARQHQARQTQNK